jgi:putative protease
MELEVFVHGAMCMAYSGRCMISQYMTERDGNRGACANACRWKYSVVEEQRPGQYFPVYEDDTGSYLYNSKDLCTIEFLDKILDAGVDGLKIEGRMKTFFYVGAVTRIYRRALDSYLSGNFQYQASWLQSLKGVSNRGYTSGFFHGKLDKEAQNLEGGYERTKELVGQVLEVAREGRHRIGIRGRRIEAGVAIQALSALGPDIDLEMPPMVNAKTSEEVKQAHPGFEVWVTLPVTLVPGDILQRDVTDMDPTQDKIQTPFIESQVESYQMPD